MPDPHAWLLAPGDLDRLPRVVYSRTGEQRIEPPLVDGEPITAAVVPPDEEPEVNLGPPRTPVERAARDYFGADYMPPGGVPEETAREEFRAPLVAFRAGWQRALEWSGREVDEAREDADRYANALVNLERERNEARAELARRSAEWDARSAEGRQQVDRLVAENDRLRQPGATNVVNIAPGRAVVAGEEYRPHPAANAWPDDAVTISYSELRALVALHLDLLASNMGKVAPWDDARRTARAMREGETPLLLSEVLDR